MRRLVTSLLALFVMIPSLALAGGSPRAHDGGFFLRLTTGFGGANTTIDDGIDELKFSGPAGDFSVAVGGVVTENLAIHGTLFTYAMSDVEAEFNGNALPGSKSDVTLGALAGGLTWWIMPANFYLSGSIGVGSLNVDAPGGDIESDAGLAFELALGKEWFVSDSWGLGVGGAYSFHNLPDDEIDENWSGHSFLVRFSATFN